MKRILKILAIIAGVVAVLWIGQIAFTTTTKSVQAQAAPVANGENDGTSNDNPDKNNLDPSAYTPSNYRQPLYDPFSNQFRPGHSFEEKIMALDKTITTAPTISITFQQNPNTIADPNSGTTTTVFTFRANLSGDNTTQTSKLQVRWDFESDDEWDTYFSRSTTAKHTFKKTGNYTVTAEVLDVNGRLFHATRKILIVKNTVPKANFTVKPLGGTSAKTFTFTTNTSTDSQYRSASLTYHFDWDGDGQWDTPFQLKNIWQHHFEQAGVYNVTMEAQDPEGLTDTFEQTVNVTENNPPKAHLTFSIVTTKLAQDSNGNSTYKLDASGSSDPEDGNRIKYRWDTDYTGRNDINFDVGFSSSPFKTLVMPANGSRTIRVQVQDQDGAMDEAIVTI